MKSAIPNIEKLKNLPLANNSHIQEQVSTSAEKLQEISNAIQHKSHITNDIPGHCGSKMEAPESNSKVADGPYALFAKCQIFCDKCEQIFSDKATFDKHHEEEHDGQRFYCCAICKKKIHFYDSFKLHYFKHEIEKSCNALKPEKCTQCKKSFSSQYALAAHFARLHNRIGVDALIITNKIKTGKLSTSQKPRVTNIYSCDECGRKFLSKFYLRLHFDSHSRWYRCELCPKAYRKRCHFIKHIVLHHNQQREHACLVCKKTYKSVRQLKIHSLTHAETRSYKCTHCEKSFLTSTKLHQHNNIHTGAKPYVCNLCGTNFTNLPNLLKHKKRHEIDPKTGLPTKLIPKLVTEYDVSVYDKFDYSNDTSRNYNYANKGLPLNALDKREYDSKVFSHKETYPSNLIKNNSDVKNKSENKSVNPDSIGCALNKTVNTVNNIKNSENCRVSIVKKTSKTVSPHLLSSNEKPTAKPYSNPILTGTESDAERLESISSEIRKNADAEKQGLENVATEPIQISSNKDWDSKKSTAVVISDYKSKLTFHNTTNLAPVVSNGPVFAGINEAVIKMKGIISNAGYSSETQHEHLISVPLKKTSSSLTQYLDSHLTTNWQNNSTYESPYITQNYNCVNEGKSNIYIQQDVTFDFPLYLYPTPQNLSKNSAVNHETPVQAFIPSCSPMPGNYQQLPEDHKTQQTSYNINTYIDEQSSLNNNDLQINTTNNNGNNIGIVLVDTSQESTVLFLLDYPQSVKAPPDSPTRPVMFLQNQNVNFLPVALTHCHDGKDNSGSQIAEITSPLNAGINGVCLENEEPNNVLTNEFLNDFYMCPSVVDDLNNNLKADNVVLPDSTVSNSVDQFRGSTSYDIGDANFQTKKLPNFDSFDMAQLGNGYDAVAVDENSLLRDSDAHNLNFLNQDIADISHNINPLLVHMDNDSNKMADSLENMINGIPLSELLTGTSGVMPSDQYSQEFPLPDLTNILMDMDELEFTAMNIHA